MNPRALYPVIAATCFAAGCTLPSTLAKSGAESYWLCDGKNKCEVSITVTSCTPDGISLDYPVIGVRKGTRKVDIIWTIADSRYEFAKKDGVKFKGSEWPKEFDLPEGNKNRYKWRDLNALDSGQRSYDYSVTIVNADGSACATKDPTVINDA
jgi:hypothetical protein